MNVLYEWLQISDIIDKITIERKIIDKYIQLWKELEKEIWINEYSFNTRAISLYFKSITND